MPSDCLPSGETRERRVETMQREVNEERLAAVRAAIVAFLEGIRATPEPISDDTALFEGLLDSFGFVELVAHVEHQTGCSVDMMEVDLDAISTVGQLARELAAVAQ